MKSNKIRTPHCPSYITSELLTCTCVAKSTGKVLRGDIIKCMCARFKKYWCVGMFLPYSCAIIVLIFLCLYFIQQFPAFLNDNVSAQHIYLYMIQVFYCPDHMCNFSHFLDCQEKSRYLRHVLLQGGKNMPVKKVSRRGRRTRKSGMTLLRYCMGQAYHYSHLSLTLLKCAVIVGYKQWLTCRHCFSTIW